MYKDIFTILKKTIYVSSGVNFKNAFEIILIFELYITSGITIPTKLRTTFIIKTYKI